MQGREGSAHRKTHLVDGESFSRLISLNTRTGGTGTLSLNTRTGGTGTLSLNTRTGGTGDDTWTTMTAQKLTYH